MKRVVAPALDSDIFPEGEPAWAEAETLTDTAVAESVPEAGTSEALEP